MAICWKFKTTSVSLKEVGIRKTIGTYANLITQLDEEACLCNLCVCAVPQLHAIHMLLCLIAVCLIFLFARSVSLSLRVFQCGQFSVHFVPLKMHSSQHETCNTIRVFMAYKSISLENRHDSAFRCEKRGANERAKKNVNRQWACV